LAKVQEQKSLDAKTVKKEAEEKEVVKTTLDNSVEQIVKRHALEGMSKGAIISIINQSLRRHYEKVCSIF